MFNFHKPRTYRSVEGCCICKAKSSSSRFTDSRKYERDTMLCFDLKYPRQGEICNACVLLVKRFKRLPVGSKRNWSHIVDAKAGIGPGYNKIQTKYKSERINSKAAAAAAAQQNENTVAAIAAVNSSNSAANGANASCSSNLPFVPEKFTKIFKKTKKVKENSSQSNSKRKTANNGWSQSNTNSLLTTPDSMDSDYEDSRANASLSGNICSSSVVQFQTQTRASAYKAQAAAEARMKIAKMGTKRRKSLPPRKNYRCRINEESLPFFAENEWSERTLCCGTLYECAALGGAILIDTANFKTCVHHQHQRLTCKEKIGQAEDTAPNFNDNMKKVPSTLPMAKSIIQTMPAVVQLQPPQCPPLPSSTLQSSSAHTTNRNSFVKTSTTSSTTPTAAAATPTPTPVLKKHHLFFKRQSECFPQCDVVTTSNNNNIDISAHSAKNNNKTESDHHHNQQQQQRQQNNINLQRHIENAIHYSSSQTNPTSTVLTDSLSTLALSVSVTPISSAATIPTMPQMPKHSLAKMTTISPPITSSVQQQIHHPYNLISSSSSSSSNNNNSTLPLAKPNGLIHKVKSDSGKIVKHSLEKFNTAVRLKTSDIINEIKPIIRTVDKSYILSKSQTQSNHNGPLNATNTATANYQSLTAYSAAGPMPITTTSLSAASPTSSTSSTSSTKFSDNSSDSGFDENMLDRKSASPLQEDCEKKIQCRPGVQTMFLASGVQIQGQQQVLTGNEVAAKILQNRKPYSTMATSSIPANSRALSSNHNPATTAVKIAQISTNSLISPASTAASCVGPQMSSMSSAAQAKMRAIYNNNNTIQHENGITTIVPASSLAATTQTAAMQNIAPSTVTITPAPPVGTQFNHQQNVISRKLTTANIINLQSNTTNNLSNSHNNASGNHHHLISSSVNSSSNNSGSSSSSNNNIHNNMANQKIILLKTSNNTTTVTASGSYNTLAGGGGQMGNCGGGR